MQHRSQRPYRNLAVRLITATDRVGAASAALCLFTSAALAQSAPPVPNSTTNHGALEGSFPARNASFEELDASTQVALHSGEVVHRATDLALEGRGLGFHFTRVYRSQVQYTGGLGPSWSHSYEQRVWSDGQGGLRHFDGERFVLEHYPSSGGAQPLSCATAGVYRKARQLASGEWEIRDAHGSILRFHPLNGAATAGRLERVIDTFGNSNVARYNGQGQLIRIECDRYHAVTAPTHRVDFTYSSGKLQTVVDVHNGRTWTYAYNAAAQLLSVSTPAVATLVNSATSLLPRTTIYEYLSSASKGELKNNLRAITYPGQSSTPGVPWKPRLEFTYDTGDHVLTASVRADNASATAPAYVFQYSALPAGSPQVLKTTVTDRRGAPTQYHFDAVGLASSILDPGGHTTTFEYNSDGEITKHIAPEGNERRNTFAVLTVADRFQHGCMVGTLHIPAPGKPGSQSPYRVQHRYEPIYNQTIDTVDEGGQVIFDYQEDPQLLAGMIADWAIQTPPIAPLGDVNGDGRTDQHAGAIIESRSPGITVGLPTGVSGPVFRTETWTYDDHGDVLSYADAEGALFVYTYVAGLLSELRADVDPDPAACPNSPGSFPNSGVARWSKGCAVAHVDARTTFQRDGRGNILEVTDPRGVISTYQYNALDDVTSSSLGASYDGARLDPDLAALVDAGYEHLVRPGVQDTVEYDPSGNIARVSSDNRGSGDPASPWVVSRFTYDMEQRLLQIDEVLTANSTATTQIQYDASGNQVRVTNAKGDVDAMVYDLHGRLQQVRRGADANGGIKPTTSVTTFEYDRNGQRTVVEGPEDLDGDGVLEKTLRQYDGRNRLARIVSPVGTESLFDYGPRGWNGRTTIRGRMNGPSPTQNSTAGNVTLAVNDADRDELGNAWRRRDLRFVIGQPVGASGPAITTLSDRTGAVVERIDELGRSETMSYDGLGRMVSSTDDLGNTTRYVYDAAGYLIETVESSADPHGGASIERRVRDTFDGAGRLIRSVSGGEVTYYAYDARGNVVAKADGRSAIVQSDPLGLVSDGPFSNPGNTTRTSYVRTASGLRTQLYSDLWPSGVASGNYAIWSAGLDPNVAPAGVVAIELTILQYDKVGNVTSVLSPGGRTTAFEYDDHSRMTVKHFPNGSRTTTTYWRDGRVRTHSMSDASGVVFRTTETSYDAAGRTRRIELTQSPAGYTGTTLQTFECNGVGLETRATDDKLAAHLLDSIVERTHDSLGRVLTETQNGHTVQYDYNDAHQTRFTFPGGRTIELDFDSHGRVQSIAESAGGASIAQYSYYGLDSSVAEAVFGNGTVKSFVEPLAGSGRPNGYSASGRPTQIKHKGPAGTPLSVFSNTYDGAGNRVLRTRTLGTSLTGDLSQYDSRRRLELFHEQRASGALISKGYLRDGDGDWTAIGIQAHPNPASLYTSPTPANDWAYSAIAGRSLDHDVAGNRVRDDWFTYEFDAFDRLTRVRDRYNSAVIATYSYDAFTRRIEKSTWITGTDRYIYDEERLVEVRDVNGSVRDQYVHGEWIDELVQWTDDAGDVRYFLTDDMGSVVGFTDAAGAVVERVSYDGFGAPTFLDPAGTVIVDAIGAPVAVSPLGNRFLFQGRDYDGELALWRRAQATPGYFAETPSAGQYNFRYRYVSPDEGRFISRDPLALASNDAIDPSLLVGRILSGESVSPYEMGSGSPTNHADPFGLSVVVVITTLPNGQRHVKHNYMPDESMDLFVIVVEGIAARMGRPKPFTSKRPCPPPTAGNRGNGDGDGRGGSGGTRGGGSNGGGGKSGGGGGGGPGGGSGGKGGTPGGKTGGGSGFMPETPKGPRPPTPPGESRGLGVVDKALSVAEASRSENPPLYYFLYCINPAPSALEKVVDRLEDKVKKDPGLPQTGGPITGSPEDIASIELYRKWKRAYDEWEKWKKNTPSSTKPQSFFDQARHAAEGAKMSCKYFARRAKDPDGSGQAGPNTNQDCRPVWKANSSANKTDLKLDEKNNQLDKQGSGLEVSRAESENSLTPTEARSNRLAALERFESSRMGKRSAPKRRDGPAPNSPRLPFALARIWGML